MSSNAFILQDPTKALVLQTTLTNGGLAIPNGTITFKSANDGSTLGSASVVNPNGVETKLAVSVAVDQSTHDSVVDSTWYDAGLTATYSVGGVNTGAPQPQSLLDNFGALAGVQGVLILDPDGHTLWAVAGGAYDQAYIQKYNLTTKSYVAGFEWPFNPQGPFGEGDLFTMEDGTSVIWLDNAGNLYGFSNVHNSAVGKSPSAVGRLHKLNPTTFAEIAALGYDDLYPAGWDGTNYPVNSLWATGDLDWALYTRGGKDYMAVVSEGGFSLSSSRAYIVNLTDMTLLGTFDISSKLGFRGHAVWVDKFGVVWFAGDSGGSNSNLYIANWNPADGTTSPDAPPQPPDPVLNNVNIVYTITGTQWQSGTPFNGNFVFAFYSSANHAVVIGNSAPAGPTGNESDLASFALSDGHQIQFVSGGTDPSPFYSGTLDVSYACMGMNKRMPWLANNQMALEIFPSAGTFPERSGGIVNITDPVTLGVISTIDLPTICRSTVTTGNGYTLRGTWTPGTHYLANDIVVGSDGEKYVAKVPSGAGSSINQDIDPTTRVSNNPSFNFPTGNAVFWSGLPTFTQRVQLSIGNNQLGTAPHSNLLWIQSTGTFVFTHEFTGSPLMMTTSNAADTTTTEVISSQNASLLGDIVTFEADVDDVPNPGTNPTGTVDFYDGAVPLILGVPLSGGVAFYSTGALNSGSHVITAFYHPTGNFAASQGVLTQVVNPPPGGTLGGLALIATFSPTGP